MIWSTEDGPNVGATVDARLETILELSCRLFVMAEFRHGNLGALSRSPYVSLLRCGATLEHGWKTEVLVGWSVHSVSITINMIQVVGYDKVGNTQGSSSRPPTLSAAVGWWVGGTTK